MNKNTSAPLSTKFARLSLVNRNKVQSSGTESDSSFSDVRFSIETFLNTIKILCTKVDFEHRSEVIYVPNTPQEMFDKVQESLPCIKAEYREDYAEPLLRHHKRIIEQLDNQEDILQTLTSAVYLKNPAYSKPEVLQSLKRFESIIGSLFDGFVNNQKRLELNMPLLETISPLATWQADPSFGPFTIPVDMTKEVFEASIAVVSLPASYMDHPVLWGSLGHETGGHDVLHADPGLLPEIVRLLKRQFPGEMGELWAHWADEAASDVYGLLNYGPSFAINLVLLLGTLNSVYGGKEYLRTASMPSGGQLDVHPTDILRLGLARGALTSMRNFSSQTRNQYLDWIDQCIEFCTRGVTEITLMYSYANVKKHDLKMMLTTASEVGRILVTARLDTLRGFSIADLQDWTDKDETITRKFSKALLDTSSDNDPKAVSQFLLAVRSSKVTFDIEHILSAATMAFFEAPDKYDSLSQEALNAIDSIIGTQTNSLQAPKIDLNKRIRRVFVPNTLDIPQQQH